MISWKEWDYEARVGRTCYNIRLSINVVVDRWSRVVIATRVHSSRVHTQIDIVPNVYSTLRDSMVYLMLQLYVLCYRCARNVFFGTGTHRKWVPLERWIRNKTSRCTYVYVLFRVRTRAETVFVGRSHAQELGYTTVVRPGSYIVAATVAVLHKQLFFSLPPPVHRRVSVIFILFSTYV